MNRQIVENVFHFNVINIHFFLISLSFMDSSFVFFPVSIDHVQIWSTSCCIFTNHDKKKKKDIVSKDSAMLKIANLQP